MKLSIIIVNWNTKDLLRNCLESIFKNYNESNFEIIVVDNNSKDESCQMAEKYFPKVKLIKNKENMGFATANNQAITISQSDNILILNPDIIIKKSAIENMLEFLKGNNNVGAVGAKLLNPDGTVQKVGYYRKFPSIIQIILFYTLLNKIFRNFPKIYSRYWEDSDTEHQHEVDQIPGACILVKREVIEKIGLLDENFFIWYEDVDWCYRIKKAGWKLYYLPSAEIIHFGGQSFLDINSGEKIIWFYSSLLKFFRKHYSIQKYSFAKFIISLDFIFINFFQILLYPFIGKKRDVWKNNISARFGWIKNVYRKEK